MMEMRFARFFKPDGTPIATVDDVVESMACSAKHSERAELFGVVTEDGVVICYTGNGPKAEYNAALLSASPDLYTAHVLRDAFEYWSFGPQGSASSIEDDDAWNKMCDLCIANGMDAKQKDDPDWENHPSKFIEDYTARAMVKARGEFTSPPRKP